MTAAQPAPARCDGCGGAETYETEADGYEIVLCTCGIARSVRPLAQRLAGATEVELVGELARRGRLLLEQPGPDLDTTLADHDERIRAAEAALVALQDWAERARGVLDETALLLELAEQRTVTDRGPGWHTERRAIVLGTHVGRGDLARLQVQLDELRRVRT